MNRSYQVRKRRKVGLRQKEVLKLTKEEDHWNIKLRQAAGTEMEDCSVHIFPDWYKTCMSKWLSPLWPGCYSNGLLFPRKWYHLGDGWPCTSGPFGLLQPLFRMWEHTGYFDYASVVRRALRWGTVYISVWGRTCHFAHGADRVQPSELSALSPLRSISGHQIWGKLIHWAIWF